MSGKKDKWGFGFSKNASSWTTERLRLQTEKEEEGRYKASPEYAREQERLRKQREAEEAEARRQARLASMTWQEREAERKRESLQRAIQDAPKTGEFWLSEDPGVTELPPFPPYLRTLKISGNRTLKSLPRLPDTISYLELNETGIRSLPNLPRHLEKLKINYTPIESLPPFPPYVHHIDLQHNLLKSLPQLPPSVEWMNVDHNPFEEPFLSMVNNSRQTFGNISIQMLQQHLKAYYNDLETKGKLKADANALRELNRLGEQRGLPPDVTGEIGSYVTGGLNRSLDLKQQALILQEQSSRPFAVGPFHYPPGYYRPPKVPGVGGSRRKTKRRVQRQKRRIVTRRR